MLRRTLAITLVATTTWISIWAAAPAAFAQDSLPGQLTKGEAVDRFESFLRLIEGLRSHIDRSQFDLEALLETLDYDANRIIKFVKEEIHFEQYPGVLRGAQGTLMSRAGNALDQAVLLAKLLRDAGFEARIAEGSLSEREVSDLLDQMRIPRKPSPPIGDIAQIESAISLALKDLGSISTSKGDEKSPGTDPPIPVTETEIFKQASEEARRVESLLIEKNAFLKPEVLMGDLRTEARDYFWVQFRLGQGSGWLDLHPAFATNDKAPRPQVVSTFQDSVPHEYSHQFAIEVGLKRRVGNRSEDVTVAKSTAQPTANLIGKAMTVTLVPNGLRGLNDYQDLDEALKRSSIWVPLINDIPGLFAFDTSGNLLDSLAAGHPGAALFQTVGGTFGKAAGALGGDERATALLDLESVWIDYLVTEPGGNESRYRSEIWGESTRGNDSTETIKRARLSSSHSIMLAVGSHPEAYVWDQSLEKLHRVASSGRAFYSGTSLEPASINTNDLETAFSGHLDIYAAFDLGLAADANSYRSGPSVVALSQSLDPPGSATALINIVRNPRRAIGFEKGLPFLNQQETVLAGVWESFVEESIMSQIPGNRRSAARSLRNAATSGADFDVILPSTASILDELPLGARSKKWIEEDMAKGFAVVLPRTQSVKQSQVVSWWRVNLKSGETLAVSEGGLGISATTELILKVAIVAALLAGAFALWGCMGTLDPDEIAQASRPKQLGCMLCWAFAAVTAFLLVMSLPALPGLYTAWLLGTPIVITAGAALLAKVMEIAAFIMGLVCGVSSVIE